MNNIENNDLQEILVFKSAIGNSEFQLILDGNSETVWLTEDNFFLLYGKAIRTIGEHIKNIYDSHELDKLSTWREFRQVQKEGKREVSRNLALFNLDLIISIGSRVNSKVGIEFRRWAIQKLKEYLDKRVF